MGGWPIVFLVRPNPIATNWSYWPWFWMEGPSLDKETNFCFYNNLCKSKYELIFDWFLFIRATDIMLCQGLFQQSQQSLEMKSWSHPFLSSRLSSSLLHLGQQKVKVYVIVVKKVNIEHIFITCQSPPVSLLRLSGQPRSPLWGKLLTLCQIILRWEMSSPSLNCQALVQVQSLKSSSKFLIVICKRKCQILDSSLSLKYYGPLTHHKLSI